MNHQLRIASACVLLAVITGFPLAAGTVPHHPVEQAEPAMIAYIINPVIDLHFYVRSFLHQGGEILPAYIDIVDRARTFETAVGGMVGWGFIEPLLTRCDTASDLAPLAEQLPERFRFRAGSIVMPRALTRPYVEALADVEPAFMRDVWPDHKQRIENAVEGLEKLLGDHGASALEYLVEKLRLNADQQPLSVHFVAEAPPPGGSTSSSRGIGIRSFVGISDYTRSALAEIVLHEVIHALDLRAGNAHHALGMLRKKMLGTGIPPMDPLMRDIPHVVVFIQANETIRRIFDADHSPYGPDSSFHQSTPEASRRVAPNWNAYLDGTLTLEETLETIVAGIYRTNGPE